MVDELLPNRDRGGRVADLCQILAQPPGGGTCTRAEFALDHFRIDVRLLARLFGGTDNRHGCSSRYERRAIVPRNSTECGNAFAARQLIQRLDAPQPAGFGLLAVAAHLSADER